MWNGFASFAAGALFNLAVATLIVRLIYYPATQEKNYVFTFIAFNTILYFVMGLLSGAQLGVGVGFGLFAIFSVLRYRTDPIPIREMTYLFVIIALPVINALMVSAEDLPHLLLANALMIAILYALEKGWGFCFQESKEITYERIGLITPEKRELLLADLRARTGLPVHTVDVTSIDLVNDTAVLRVYYREPRSPAQAPWEREQPEGSGWRAEP
jgi:hypothetical protein